MGGQGSRLAIAAIFLAFIVVFFAFELTLSRLKIFLEDTLGIKKNSVSKFQYFFPFGFAILGIIIIPIMLSDKSAERRLTEIDPDIGGPGIRSAIWAQVLVLILIAIIGTFHTKANGAKEIGAGLIITHISLAVALLVEMTKRKVAGEPERQLKAADAILGCMILDSQNIALSIPLVIKETLASRWQVCITVACQCFGLVVMAVIVEHFGRGLFLPNQGKDCINVVWWGWLSSCRTESSTVEMNVFRVYYACRWLILFQTSFHALSSMSTFHQAEKNRANALGTITFPALIANAPWSVKLVEFLHITKPAPGPYGKYPTTVSLMYVLYGVFSLASLAAAESAVQTVPDRDTDDFSVGQVIAVVVAGATILRGFCLFFLMCKEKHGRRVLPNPLHP